MYIPPHFSFTEYAETVAFMQRYNFATIVSTIEGEPFATHLPFVVEQDEDGHVKLLAHFAKNNPQWQVLESQHTLVIFAEPHAYISPSLYERRQSVPTWNYVAVHAYGQATLLQDDTDAFSLLEKQMQVYEKEYIPQWRDLKPDYKNALVKGMVAFEMEVTKLEAKRKLSQNRTDQERQNVLQHLLRSDDSVVRAIGEIMAN